jgi:probable O-glycosylation ligase (exosortase A-associated)
VRDLVITAIVAGLLPLTLRHAYVGVLLWTWLSTMNPHRMAYGFAFDMPFAAATAGVTLVALFTTRDRLRWPSGPTVTLLTLFIAWMCITTQFAFFVEDSTTQLVKVLKIQLMTFVALAVLTERRHLQLFVWINVLSLGFFGVKGGLFTLATGGNYRVWGPPGGFIEGNNELALALVMAIPLMNYLRLSTENVWIKRGLLVMMGLSALSAIGTHSRGALLAIAAMAVVLWWRAPGKLALGGFLIAVGLGVAAFMPENWYDRMGTIQEYQEDASAMGRINAWWTMFNLANDRALGGGFWIYVPEVFRLYAPDPSVPRAAHSIYFQVLGEHGWIGLGLFLGVWISVWYAASSVRRLTKESPDGRWAHQLAGMCQVSLVGYAVGGAFLSLSYFDLPYNILVAVIALSRLMVAGDAVPKPTMDRGSAVEPMAPRRARLSDRTTR